MVIYWPILLFISIRVLILLSLPELPVLPARPTATERAIVAQSLVAYRSQILGIFFIPVRFLCTTVSTGWMLRAPWTSPFIISVRLSYTLLRWFPIIFDSGNSYSLKPVSGIWEWALLNPDSFESRLLRGLNNIRILLANHHIAGTRFRSISRSINSLYSLVDQIILALRANNKIKFFTLLESFYSTLLSLEDSMLDSLKVHYLNPLLLRHLNIKSAKQLSRVYLGEYVFPSGTIFPLPPVSSDLVVKFLSVVK